MKKPVILMTIVCMALTGVVRIGTAAGQRIGFALRQHSEDATIEGHAFGDDISYCLAYEWEEGGAFWQAALDYAPDVDTTNAVDYVLTPQVNLLFKDKGWRGGVGILKSMVADDETGNDWTDIYFQWILGMHIPVFGMKFNVTAYYLFEDFGDLGDFDSGNIEYALWFKYAL